MGTRHLYWILTGPSFAVYGYWYRRRAYDGREGGVAGCQGKLVRKGLGMGKDVCEIVDYSITGRMWLYSTRGWEMM
jgi:hypothetical protein